MPIVKTFPNSPSTIMPIIVPLRVAKGITLDPRDPDPRGMKVIGCDGQVGGIVIEAGSTAPKR